MPLYITALEPLFSVYDGVLPTARRLGMPVILLDVATEFGELGGVRAAPAAGAQAGQHEHRGRIAVDHVRSPRKRS
ncbi:hypothetical protein [Streptomyces sp. NPDC101150]|uniref:hypothetical protein n=1 Tax=Streptomyces sp. NPDC101150 TaxID=3366114 RepID=UPI0037F79E7A